MTQTNQSNAHNNGQADSQDVLATGVLGDECPTNTRERFSVGAGGPDNNPASDPFDPAALRLSQDFASSIGVKKVLTVVPCRKPNRHEFVRFVRARIGGWKPAFLRTR